MGEQRRDVQAESRDTGSQHTNIAANLHAEGYPERPAAGPQPGKDAAPQSNPNIYTDKHGEVHNRLVESMVGTQSQFVNAEIANMNRQYRAGGDPDKIFQGIAADAFKLYQGASPAERAEYRKVLGLDANNISQKSIYDAQMADRRATLGVKDPNDKAALLRAYLGDAYRNMTIDYN